MCGTVGLFVGCAALDMCPRSLLERSVPSRSSIPEPDADGDADYRSPFARWHDRASVRTAPRRVLPDGRSGSSAVVFPPELVPVATHPVVTALPPHVFDEVLLQHLYRYLDFTSKLEMLVVNRTVAGIAQGTVGVPLPEEMRYDAYKIYCDEAYHSLFSVDLARQVRRLTGVRPRDTGAPRFLRTLELVLAGEDSVDRPLVELLFVIVSETLISASLAEIPQHQALLPAVREMMQDHAVDEGRHHAYFALFLRHLWGHLDRRERQLAGRVVPSLIDAFLSPDLEALGDELTAYGLSRSAVHDVLDEVYAPDVVAAHTARTSRVVRRYFRDLGAFEHPAAAEQLALRGLDC